MNHCQIKIDLENSLSKIPLNVMLVVDKLVREQETLLTRCCLETVIDDTQTAAHQIELVVQGKSGIYNEYVADTAVLIRSITINGMDVSAILETQAQYHHDYNGTGQLDTMPYTSNIGFDGTLCFELATPVYRWLFVNQPH